MARLQLLDLDVLDSPAISVHSHGSDSSSRPSSSIAEKIFNDPDSWHDADETLVDDGEMTDVMAWLAEEIEKYHGHARGGIDPLPSIDQSPPDVRPKSFSACHKPNLEPAMASSRMPGIHMKWESMLEEELEDDASLPPFELSRLDLSLDLNDRLSNIWNPGSTSPQSLPSPIIFSPPSSASTTDQSMITPDTTCTSTSLPPLDLALQSAKSPTPLTSPVAILSASTTWSILELYGVHPDTPDSGRPLIGPHPSVILPVSSTVSSASCPITPPPNLLTIQSSAAVKVTNETTQIRPLPLVPDSARGSPTPPSHTEIPKILYGKSSKCLRPPFYPSTSAPALPSRKPLLHELSKSRQPLLPDIQLASSFSKSPGLSQKQAISLDHQHSCEPRPTAPLRTNIANLTRFVSLPLPYPRPPVPQPAPPPTMPSSQPSRPGSAVRSPPLGPRAQSSMPLQSR
jgi:hypothetical protein